MSDTQRTEALFRTLPPTLLSCSRPPSSHSPSLSLDVGAYQVEGLVKGGGDARGFLVRVVEPHRVTRPA